jgi:hypothetical protein
MYGGEMNDGILGGVGAEGEDRRSSIIEGTERSRWTPGASSARTSRPEDYSHQEVVVDLVNEWTHDIRPRGAIGSEKRSLANYLQQQIE